MTVHIPKRDPPRRQNSETKWPNGVLSAGRIIDILESLSTMRSTYDYEIVLWLLANYVEPFGKLGGLDGLVVTKQEDL